MKLLILVLLSLYISNGASQTKSPNTIEINDTIKFIVKYNLSYKYDSSDFSKVHKESLLLIAFPKVSLFIPYNKYLQDSIDQNDLNKVAVLMNEIDATKRKTSPLPIIFRNNEHISEIHQLMENFSINDTIKLFWTLHEEVKDYEGIAVRKATTSFKGRHYIAWYAPSIPIDEGPYKFKGLPGLILELSDTKDDLHIYYRGTYNTSSNYYKKTIIQTVISRYDYTRIAKRVVDDPMEYIREMAAAKGVTIAINSSVLSDNTYKKRTTILNPSNPIEFY
jgi:GLPGLI family protein